MVDMALLEPGFRDNVQGFIDDINKQYADQGITWQPTSGYRSMKEQQQLWDAYSQGKSQGLPDSQLVKAAPPGGSFHNYGGALDIMPYRDGKQLSNDEAIPLLNRVAPTAVRHGLYWGGNFGDMDHFQAAKNLGPWLDQSGRRNWRGPDSDTSAPVAPPSSPLPMTDDQRQAQVDAGGAPPNTFERTPDMPIKTAASGAGTPPDSGSGIVPALDQAISNTAARTGVPADYLRTIAMIESNGGRNLASPLSSARGPFQFTSGTAQQMGLSDPMDFQQSSDAAARLALQNKDAMERMLGRNVGWDEVYLAHQQGSGGAQALLDNPDRPAKDVLGSVKAVANNLPKGSGFSPETITAGQFANIWLQKYRGISGGSFAPLPAPGRAVPSYVNPSVAAAAAQASPVDTTRLEAMGGLPGTPMPQEAPPAPPGGSLADVYASALKSTELAENGNAELYAGAEAVARRNAAIKDAIGVSMDNPLDPAGRAEWAHDHGVAWTPAVDVGRDERVDAMRRQDYQERLAGLAQQYPEKAGIIGPATPILDWAAGQAPAIAMEARARAGAAYELSGGGFWPFAASMAGQFAGGMRDPMQAAALVAGGPEVKAASVFGRLAGVAVRDAAINVGLDLAHQATTQEWRKKIGDPTGLNMEELGYSAMFGAVPGAGIQAGREVAGLLGRIARGELPAAAEAARALPPGMPTTLPQTVLSEALDRQEKVPPVPGGPPQRAGKPAIGADGRVDATPAPVEKPAPPMEGEAPTRLAEVTPEENAQKLRESIRFAENPGRAPKPDPPSEALIPPPAQPHLVAEGSTPASRDPLPLPEPGHPATFDYAGKPVHFEAFKPGDLSTDAAQFQYKGGGDYRGVTDRLGGVAQWDPLASGKVIVFEQSDGRLVIADGHQRLGLAQRLDASSPTPIELNGYVFREADGWTPQDVRAIAAKKNIQEGSGDVLDTARVLRERPDLWDATLPMSDLKIKQAQGLARLSPEAWQMTLNGVVPGNYAAALGRMVDNVEHHAAIMGDLARLKPTSEVQARLIIGDALEAGVARHVQDSLFGPQEVTRSLMQERAQVYAETLALLKEDKRVFAVLDREQTRIEAEGNTLQPDANRARATRAAQLEQALGTLASRSGPVSAALNRWAAQLAEKTISKAEAARSFADELVPLIEKEGLRIEPKESDVPAPARPAETPAERQAQTERLREQLREEMAAAEREEAVARTGLPEERAEAAPPAETPETPVEAQRTAEREPEDLWERVPLADAPDGSDMRGVSREAALGDDLTRDHSDLIRSCKP